MTYMHDVAIPEDGCVECGLVLEAVVHDDITVKDRIDFLCGLPLRGDPSLTVMSFHEFEPFEVDGFVLGVRTEIDASVVGLFGFAEWDPVPKREVAPWPMGAEISGLKFTDWLTQDHVHSGELLRDGSIWYHPCCGEVEFMGDESNDAMYDMAHPDYHAAPRVEIPHGAATLVDHSKEAA